MSYQAVKAILAKGISRPTLFQVIMPIGRLANDQLEFMCKTAAVPEVSVDTIVVNGHESQGVVREQATMVTYAKPFQITVISDRDYTVYKAMREWFDTLAENANPFSRESLLSGDSQRVNYYNSVTKQITLRKLEQNGKQGYHQPFEVEFNNAYPIRIGELQLDTESTDSRMEFTVSFTYETYTMRNDSLLERLL